jgi:hypothetical protein
MKLKKILVKCLVMDSDGCPVDGDGEPIFGTRKKPWYIWEPRWRGEKWLRAHPDLWKPLPASGGAA